MRENARVRASRLNGARMPSIAEDVATDVSTVRLRTAGSRRYRLVEESFELMAELWHGTAHDEPPRHSRLRLTVNQWLFSLRVLRTLERFVL